jgi:phospholipase D1/2|tara:strand:- start:26952 stop:27194 length:243 start_codon:yes stop_codon:yes gene_type:complete
MSFLNKLHEPFHGFVSDLKDTLTGKDDQNKPPQGQASQQSGQQQPQPGQEYHSQHRFSSFAPERHGNDTKWYVDGVSGTT